MGWWYVDGQRCAEQEFSRRQWWYERQNLVASMTSAGIVISCGPLSLGQMIRERLTVEGTAFDLGTVTLGM